MVSEKEKKCFRTLMVPLLMYLPQAHYCGNKPERPQLALSKDWMLIWGHSRAASIKTFTERYYRTCGEPPSGFQFPSTVTSNDERCCLIHRERFICSLVALKSYHFHHLALQGSYSYMCARACTCKPALPHTYTPISCLWAPSLGNYAVCYRS